MCPTRLEGMAHVSVSDLSRTLLLGILQASSILSVGFFFVCFWYVGFLLFFFAMPAYFCLRTFVLAVSSAFNVLPLKYV